MKQQVTVVLSLAMAVGLLIPVYAYAQEQKPATQRQETTAQQPKPTTAAPSDSKSELNARLEERKTKLQTRPSKAEETRIGSRCTAAQEKFPGFIKKFADNDTPSRAKHEAFLARLDKVIQKAGAQGIDTTDLKKNRDDYQQKYQAMIAAVSTLNLSISDLKSVDCKTDPVAFKATLETARAQLKEVQAARAELTKIAKGPLLDSIKAIKTSAEKKKN